jgi:hypothetical protein
MEQQQLTLGSKVKLKLVQPRFICSGRDAVSCTYKGTIVQMWEKLICIEFKYRKELIKAWYHLGEKSFVVNEELKDIKLIV